ncbi:MAG: hypothetical protein K5790_02605 [Nitrosopumilus sp.]|uniref:hypothetical protein n=1 Tax=Nitrosopumilus sp. TaxID=2024843 RepID=UPI00247EB67C|nr:hypothetical protein [Nitrosopumilus sp.]MCV0392167.1 hypothetical protein [Nitrosopumilus sp.]
MRMVIFALIPLILSIGLLPPVVFSEGIDSPRKQMSNGVSAEDVICKSGLTLMIRMSGDAACVTATTAEKLEEKGWGTIEKEFNSEPETTETEINEELDISDESSTSDSTQGKDHSVELKESIGLKGN